MKDMNQHSHIVFIAVLSCFLFSSCIPSQRQCHAVGLRAESGGSLTVRKDGSGSVSYGTGIQMQREIKKGTFDFSNIYRQARQMLNRPITKAEDPYIAVSFWKEGQSSAVEHEVQVDSAVVDRLFSLAWQKAEPSIYGLTEPPNKTNAPEKNGKSHQQP